MAAQADKTNTGVVGTIVVVGALSMIAISALLTAMARSEQRDLDSRSPQHADLETVAQLRSEQVASLEAAPHWEDQAKGKVALPIRQAMRLVLDEYRADPRAASPEPPPGMVLAPDPEAPAAGGEGAAAGETAAGATMGDAASEATPGGEGAEPSGAGPAAEGAGSPPSAPAPSAPAPSPAVPTEGQP